MSYETQAFDELEPFDLAIANVDAGEERPRESPAVHRGEVGVAVVRLHEYVYGAADSLDGKPESGAKGVELAPFAAKLARDPVLLAAEDVLVNLLRVERLHQLRALPLEPLDLAAESRSLLLLVGAELGGDAPDAFPNQVGRLAAQANGRDEPIGLLVGDLDADVRLRAAALAQAVEVVVAAAAALAP